MAGWWLAQSRHHCCTDDHDDDDDDASDDNDDITILSTFIYFIKSFTTFIHFHPLSFFGPLFQTLFGIMIFWNNDPGVLSYIEADEERTA